MNPKMCYLKIDVSCEGSVNFQHIPQNATSATEFAHCHRAQPWQCDSQKLSRKTGVTCCACNENCNASSETDARVLRLPRQTTFDTWRNTSECHEVPRLPRETKQRDAGHLQKVSPVAELTIGTAILRPSHGHLWTVANRCAPSSEHNLNPQTPRVKREPLLRIREKMDFTKINPD